MTVVNVRKQLKNVHKLYCIVHLYIKCIQSTKNFLRQDHSNFLLQISLLVKCEDATVEYEQKVKIYY